MLSVSLLSISGIDSSIIQTAATERDTKTSFDTYVQPSNGYIPRHIAHLTQIEMHGTSVYRKMVPVKSVVTKQAIGLFRDWLAQYDRTILVAHNVQFDLDWKPLIYPNRIFWTGFEQNQPFIQMYGHLQFTTLLRF